MQLPTAGSAASILRRDRDVTIENWRQMVEQDAELTWIPLSRKQRVQHLARLFEDVIVRLRLGPRSPAQPSPEACSHGKRRRAQGFTPAMLVEESRFLEVSIFRTLQRNFGSAASEQLFFDIVTIADECDSQLKQAMLGYGESSVIMQRKNKTLEKKPGRESSQATLARVKKEMELPRVARSAREGLRVGGRVARIDAPGKLSDQRQI